MTILARAAEKIEASIPDRLLNPPFPKWHMSCSMANIPNYSVEKILRAYFEACNNCPEIRLKNLFLTGPANSGKTLLASQLAKMFSYFKLRPCYVRAEDYMHDAKSQDIAGYPVAIIENVELDRFHNVDVMILERVDLGKQVIVTSALPPGELSRGLNPRLAAKLCDHDIFHVLSLW